MARSLCVLLCFLVVLGSACGHSDVGARRLFQAKNVTAPNVTAVVANVTALRPNATLPAALNVTNATLPPSLNRINTTLPSTLNTTLLPNVNTSSIPLNTSNILVNTSTIPRPLNLTANSSTYGALTNSSRYQILDITNFGAKGDGIANDTLPFLAAMQAACKLGPVTNVVSVPYNKTFLIGSIVMKNCSNVVLEVMGTIKAFPYGSPSWPANPQGLLYLQTLTNFTVQGNGTIDGTGYDWWQGSFNSSNTLVRPDIIHFLTGSNLTITGIKLVNAPQVALYLRSFKGVVIDGITILAPPFSPNTDGIDLTSASNVIIKNCYIDTGDDNVALKQGCNGVTIQDTYCGNGHGTSIGSLGQSTNVNTVSNVLVNNVTYNNTLYGARIKTFPRCQGRVTNVTFSNLAMNNVSIPIYIEGKYDFGTNTCSNNSAAISIDNITYSNITGTAYTALSSTLAGAFNCDSVVPCTNITLSNIVLKPAGSNVQSLTYSPCNWIEGTAFGTMVPALSGCQQIVNATSTA